MEIFDVEDKKRVLEALKLAEDVRKEIEKAKRAGIDVTAEEELLASLTGQLEGIRRVYIPKRVPGSS